jgi:hypothetical protein
LSECAFRLLRWIGTGCHHTGLSRRTKTDESVRRLARRTLPRSETVSAFSVYWGNPQNRICDRLIREPASPGPLQGKVTVRLHCLVGEFWQLDHDNAGLLQ